MRIIKLMLIVLGAAVLLSVFTNLASARSLSISNQTWRASWSRLNYAGGFGTWECEVTLEGSFHARTIAKVVGTLVGYITAAIVRQPCIRGEATILRETLPWHIRYGGFAGALPNITSMNYTVIGFSYRIREPTFGAICLARTTPEQPMTWVLNRAGGIVTSVNVGGTIRCRGGIEVEATLSGASTAVGLLTNIATKITVTLI